MLKALSVFLLCTLSLSAYSDFDMDGVDDALDRCPNTSMTELVDMHGCTIKNLEGDHHFDVILGANYSQIDPTTQEQTDTFAASIQADYYYKNFSIQVSAAYFNSESTIASSSGQTDTFVGAYYQLYPADALSLRLGGGLLLPTYKSDFNNNNLDYSASANLSYLLNNFNLFGSYSYTVINDDDFGYTDATVIPTETVDIRYQNTGAFNIGIGFYPTARLYTSLAYNHSDSIYEKIVTNGVADTIEPLQTASAYIFYTISKERFVTLSYAYGLSDSASDHSAAVRIGHYF
ncbi:MAG: thrombospondin type 3 repeat-containing protein [Campylobacterota bacterium]